MLGKQVIEDNLVVNFEVTENKPFNKCFQCHSFRNGCSGPNLMAMTIERACEFLQLARVFLKYSYQKVADACDLSLATVKRLLTGKISDPNFYTISAVAVYLTGDPNGKYPCAIPNTEDESVQKLNDALRELERALNDNKDYREVLDGIHASYNAEMQQIRDESQKKIEFLVKEIESLRLSCDYWRVENERKGKIIDKYFDEIMSK